MTPRVRYNFLIDEAQRDGIRMIKQRDGIPESEQIRRAIDMWLESRDVRKSDRKRAAMRKRRLAERG